MVDKATQKRWDRFTRMEDAFPKALDAAAIRKLRDAIANPPPTEEGEEEARCLDSIFNRTLINIVSVYVAVFIVPQEFAARRRRAGDPFASPSDYDCRCPVRDADGVPICLRKRADCKFAGLRASHWTEANDFTGLESAWMGAERASFWRIMQRVLNALAEELASIIAEMDREVLKVRRRRARGPALPEVGAPYPIAETKSQAGDAADEFARRRRNVGSPVSDPAPRRPIISADGLRAPKG